MSAPMLTTSHSHNSILNVDAQSSLNQAKRINPNDNSGKILDSARQLEAVFLGMMFNEMAKTVPKEDGLFPKSPGSELYEEWFRTEVAKDWATGGGAGIGDTIARSMGIKPEEIDAHRPNTFRGPDYIRNMARNPSRGVKSVSQDAQLRRFTKNIEPVGATRPSKPSTLNLP